MTDAPFFAPLIVEARKLNRSLAAVLAVAAPSLIAIFVFFNMLRGKEAAPWDMWMVNASAIWAFFMLPMSVTALTALTAHMEHGPKTWDHLFALPVARWRILTAKVVAVVTVVAAMSVMLFGLAWLAGQTGGWLRPEVAARGAFPAADFASKLALILAAGLLLIAVQLWTALRFRSFVPGLVLGIGGTFFAVVATGAKEGVFLPWQMPINMMGTDPARVQMALALGSIGGVVAMLAMIVHLSHRDVL